ncbi:MAG: hypothetical protein AAGH15_01485 [Myxococcota bacterium]
MPLSRKPWWTTLLLVAGCFLSVAGGDGFVSPVGHWARLPPPDLNTSCFGEVEFLSDGTIERDSFGLFSAFEEDPLRSACTSLPRWEPSPDTAGATRVPAECFDGRTAWVDFRLVPAETFHEDGFELEVIDAFPRDLLWSDGPGGTWVRCRNDGSLGCRCDP